MNVWEKVFLFCVLFFTILGWIVFWDKTTPHCGLEDCPKEFVILLQIQISQMFYLGFQCFVLWEHVWSKTLWCSWGCVVLMVLWVFLFECYTLSQTPTLFITKDPFEWLKNNVAAKRSNQIFVSTLFLNPVYLFMHLLFAAKKQVHLVYDFVHSEEIAV